ncbi:MAG: hypothetical protein JRD47_05760 [Deltaproteobacteria bacterium]|nr:hypothetical protein [Deltaproteobacteria bacterium]MBW2266071.1 hypothetical protein [Deltaproteobacteria bacterium]MBW2318520.1 hypothetical protein [Deltaproteobacteria bacterium]MBW2601415.1 hypothetical protein [Deltaproteobacteria bacterium]
MTKEKQSKEAVKTHSALWAQGLWVWAILGDLAVVAMQRLTSLHAQDS